MNTVLALVSLLLYLSVANSAVTQKEFEEYLLKYKKTYNDQTEKLKRFNLYKGLNTQFLFLYNPKKMLKVLPSGTKKQQEKLFLL